MSNNLDEKLSLIVQDQIPDFVRDTYPVFQTFLEKYYEQGEQIDEIQYNIQKAKAFADIDETANAFVDYFVDQFGYNVPKSIFKDQQFLVDSGLVSSTESKRSFVKRLVDYHSSKGSEKSIRLLFRLLFNADISVFYPKVDIFRPSDSEWKPVKTISLYDPLANVIVSNYGAGQVRGVDSGATVIIDSLYSLKLINGATIPLYEMKIESDTLTGTFIPGERVSLSYANLITGNLDLVANIKFFNTISSIDILDPGTGYSEDVDIYLDDITDVNNFLGTVSRVGSTGQLKTLGIINPITDLDNEVNLSTTFNVIFNTTPLSYNGQYSLKSNIADIILFSSGNSINHGMTTGDTINLTFTTGVIRGSNTYTVNSVLNSKKFNVANTLIKGNANVITGAVTLDAREANVKPAIGAIATYPSEFLNKNSQLSDVKKIQDGDYYQEYSYELTADQSSYLWKDIIKKSIHPVGYKLFTKVFLVFANSFSATKVEPGGAYTTSLMRIQITNPIGAQAPSRGLNQLVLESIGRISRDVYKYRGQVSYYRNFDKWKFYNSSIRIYEVADWTPELVTNNYEKPTDPQFAFSTNVYQGGSNIILNSRFTSSSNWTLGSGHAINLNNLTITSSSANTIQQYNTDANAKYMATYEIRSRSAGSVRFSSNTASNTYVGISRSTPGIYSEIFWVDRSVANVIIAPSSFTGNISNVHVKKLTIMLG
jgi:hypothetical protein